MNVAELMQNMDFKFSTNNGPVLYIYFSTNIYTLFVAFYMNYEFTNIFYFG